MNVFLLIGILALLLSSIIANKIKRNAFAALSNQQQEDLHNAMVNSNKNKIIFIVLLIMCLLITIFPTPYTQQPFAWFVGLMMSYSLYTMWQRIVLLKQKSISPNYIQKSILANVILLFGVIVFVVLFALSNYRW
jgi:4-hydroxybenzoate polyprenyltransferase